ncbi:MAG: ATP-grasp domain-containing protein [Hydrotalea sp.]|nr:ATP-grasp domain-containing protein [Hydrotalea sp.]
MAHHFSSPQTIGILGGGQLGRMLIMAGAAFGARFVVWDAADDAPAMQLAAKKILGGFDDENLLQEFLSSVDSVMIEWENIPVALVKKIAAQKPIIAPDNLLEIAQSRLAEKNFFLKTPTQPVPFAAIMAGDDQATIEKKIAQANINFPAILKTDRMGYDGKGQYPVASVADILIITQQQPTNFVLEQKINFVAEGSVLVARDFAGGVVAYPMVQNEHRHGILHRTSYPAESISMEIQEKAIAATKQMAIDINCYGLLCVEYFITGGGDIIANEMAPRPHNSFHWTIEGASVSQFLQMVRIAMGLPVVLPLVGAQKIEMYNILGDDIKNAEAVAKKPNYFLHLYGKAVAKPDRKMGHYTILL